MVGGTELVYLETFRAVCTEGGFTAAAARLGRSQPAVSYQIRRLEQLLGVKLIERSGRRIVLTPEGQRFRDFAERVFADLARARSEVVDARRVEPLRLGSASGFGRYVLLPALLALRSEVSDAASEVRLQYDAADVILDNLESGNYEAAFVYKRRVSNVLLYEPVYDEELVLIAHPALAAELSQRAAFQLDNIGALPFVTYEECDYVFGRWFEACFGAQPARLVSASHFTELEEVIAFVAAGAGVSIVPRDSAEAACARGEVVLVRAGVNRCFNQVFVVRRAGSDVRPVLRRLVASIASRDVHRLDANGDEL